MIHVGKNPYRWRTSFAYLPTQVGFIGPNPVTVWLEQYEWRYVEQKDPRYGVFEDVEYRPANNSPEGFKPFIWFRR